MRELDNYDRAELAARRAEQDDLHARGFHRAATWKQEAIDAITGEDDD